MSGQAQCELPKPQCGLKGMCNGAIIEVVNNLTVNSIYCTNIDRVPYFHSSLKQSLYWPCWPSGLEHTSYSSLLVSSAGHDDIL